MKLKRAAVGSIFFSPVVLFKISNRTQMTVAMHANDFGAAKDLDVGGVRDPMGQITRHALAKISATNEQEDLSARSAKDKPQPGRQSLPPPTSMTSEPRHICASLGVAA